MKKGLLYLLVLLLITSCSVPKDVIGNYYKKGADYQFSLQLSKDSTFTLLKKYLEANPTCTGKWHQVSKETIRLECGVEDLTASLTNGYMTDREQLVTIRSSSKVKIGNVVLNRQK